MRIESDDGFIRQCILFELPEISLFAHVLILVTENGSVYSTFEGQPLTSLDAAIHGVGLVAFDWLTDTLYWTSKQLNAVIVNYQASCHTCSTLCIVLLHIICH